MIRIWINSALLFLSIFCFGQNIEEMEYYIDTDPGVGNGINVPISPNSEIEELVSIPTSSLSEGFHIAVFRVRKDTSWSIDQTVPFMVSNTQLVALENIQYLEYFIDDVPLEGNGESITISPNNLIDQVEMISTDTISEGFHTVGVRARDDQGNWSIVSSRPFYVNTAQATIQNQISRVEYYIDIDPGVGNAEAISITSATDIDVLTSIQTDTLSQGMHTLVIRSQDDQGNWGLQGSRAFYVSNTELSVNNIITDMEYFIDDDPGVGNGTDVPLSAAVAIDHIENIPTDTLAIGFHTLNIRIQDDQGNWSVLDNQPFVVAKSNAVERNQVIAMEYFFDTDPGISNATAINSTDTSELDYLGLINSRSLSKGFHSLNVRALDSDSIWGILNTRPFFVGRGSRDTIIQGEYFIDNDPGVSMGTAFTFSDRVALDTTILAMTNLLDTGNHTFAARIMSKDTTWGLIEQFSFYITDDSCIFDSVSLANVYLSTSDSGWIRETNWLTGPIGTWEGVGLNGCRVDSLNLERNNLANNLYPDIGNLTELRYLNLGHNPNLDSIGGIVSDTNLVTLVLSGLNLNSIPDFSSLPFLNELRLDSNRLDFGDLLPLNAVPNLTANPQAPVTRDTIIRLMEGFNFDISALSPGLGNTYQWYKDSSELTNASDTTFEIIGLTLADSGSYYCVISNPALPGVTLNTGFFNLEILPMTTDSCLLDSLTMVEFYNSTNGPNWLDNSNWLTGPIDTWFGVGLDGCRVDTISLRNNNVTGYVPDVTNNLTQLNYIDLSNNRDIDSIFNFNNSSVTHLSLNNFGLIQLPDFTAFINLAFLDIRNNFLDFSHIQTVTSTSIPTILYDPQNPLTANDTFRLEASDTLDLILTTAGSSLNYQWFFDSNAITNETDSILRNADVQLTNAGEYYCEVTSPSIPGLVLRSGLYVVFVSAGNVDTVSTTNEPVTFNAVDILPNNCRQNIGVNFQSTTDLGTIQVSNNQIIFTPNGPLGTDTLDYILTSVCGSTNNQIVVTVNNAAPEFIIEGGSIIVPSNKVISIPLSSIISDFNDNEDISTARIISQTNEPEEGSEGDAPIANIDSSFTLEINYSESPFIGLVKLQMEVSDSLGATTVDEVIIDFTFEIEVVNAVSLNDDGINDYFQIKNIHRYENNNVRLYTKWGDLIYDESGYNNEDIKFTGLDQKGQMIPDGTYYYVIELGIDNDPCTNRGGKATFNCNGFVVIKK